MSGAVVTTRQHHGSVSSAVRPRHALWIAWGHSLRPPYFDLDLVLRAPQRVEKRMLTSTRLSNRGYRQPVTSVIGERKHRGRPTTSRPVGPRVRHHDRRHPSNTPRAARASRFVPRRLAARRTGRLSGPECVPNRRHHLSPTGLLGTPVACGAVDSQRGRIRQPAAVFV